MPKRPVEVSLEVGDVFIALFLRSDLASFHWALSIYLGKSEGDEGGERTGSGTRWVKMHAKNTHGGVWEYERAFVSNVEEEASVLVKIGNMECNPSHLPLSETLAQVDVPLRKIPHRTDRVDGGRKTRYDCIIWLRMAVRELMQIGILDLDFRPEGGEDGRRSMSAKGTGAVRLEEECRALGDECLRIRQRAREGGSQQEPRDWKEGGVKLVESRHLR